MLGGEVLGSSMTIGHKFKELEALSIECNQALRRFSFPYPLCLALVPL